MHNEENIIPHQFKPGVSGNPAGKPKGTRSISSIIREYLEAEIEVTDPITKTKGKKKISEVISLKMLQQAINGDMRAMQEILDRTEGKAAQRIDFGGQGEDGSKPGIQIEIIHTNVKAQGDSSTGKESGGAEPGNS